ncbi:MAG: folylpolyglutamate synthase/dihydrofolate synthase family protein [Pseudomonadota bacterium]
MSSDHILERLMSLHPKVIDLTLDRVWRLLDRLGNPQNELPNVIHIAGTNGKGSVLSMLRAGLEGAGHKVNAYTSPHLARFHERIRLGGELIDEDLLSAILEECETVNGGEPITYFEITTVAGLLAFARAEAEYTLLEVGLGGRLDATNVIEEPALAVITPVSMDHEQFLGTTLAAIAGEKAGILKPGCFGVVGRQEDEALTVIEQRAWDIGATLKIHGQHWHVWEENGRLVFQDEYGLVELPKPALLGAHQLDNAGIVIASLRLLGADDTALEKAMIDAVWPARMQRLKSGPLVEAAGNAELWLDGGHNPAAGMALADLLDSLPDAPTFLVTGMLNTKDAQGFLGPVVEKAAMLYAVQIPGEEAALSADQLADIATGLGAEAKASDDVHSAVSEIVKNNPRARIVICGSLYLAGHILKDNS